MFPIISYTAAVIYACSQGACINKPVCLCVVFTISIWTSLDLNSCPAEPEYVFSSLKHYKYRLDGF